MNVNETALLVSRAQSLPERAEGVGERRVGAAASRR